MTEARRLFAVTIDGDETFSPAPGETWIITHLFACNRNGGTALFGLEHDGVYLVHDAPLMTNQTLSFGNLVISYGEDVTVEASVANVDVIAYGRVVYGEPES